VLCRNLEGHAHWVNTLAMSTDYVLRTGPSDPVAGLHIDHSKSEYIFMIYSTQNYVLNSRNLISFIVIYLTM